MNPSNSDEAENKKALDFINRNCDPRTLAELFNTSFYSIIAQSSANLRKSIEKECESKIDFPNIANSFKHFLQSHDNLAKIGTSYGSSVLNGVVAQLPAIKVRDYCKSQEYDYPVSSLGAATMETLVGGPLEVLASRATVQKYNQTINTMSGVARLSIGVSPFFLLRNYPSWLIASNDNIPQEQKAALGAFAGAVTTIPDTFSSFVMTYYDKTTTYPNAVKLAFGATKNNPQILLLSLVPRIFSISAGTILLSEEAQEKVGDFIKNQIQQNYPALDVKANSISKSQPDKETKR